MNAVDIPDIPGIKIEYPIGSGGTADVYLGSIENKSVAVKVYNVEKAWRAGYPPYLFEHESEAANFVVSQDPSLRLEDPYYTILGRITT